MRRHMAQRLSLLAALSGLVWSQVANAQRIQADPPEHYTIPLAMEPLERHGIPLQEAHIILAQGPDGAAGAVAVVLHKTKCMTDGNGGSLRRQSNAARKASMTAGDAARRAVWFR